MRAFSLQAANGVSSVYDVSGFRHITFSVIGGAGAALTLNVRAGFNTIDSVNNNISTASTVDSPWAYVQTKNYDTGGFDTGTTGIAVSAGTSQHELNTNGIDTICFEVTGYTAGAVTVYMNGYTNA